MRGLVGCSLTTTFSGSSTLQMLRMHMAEPRSGPLQLTALGAIHHSNYGTIALEPSRSVVITEPLLTNIQIRDWDLNRSIVISTIRADIDLAYVCTFRG